MMVLLSRLYGQNPPVQCEESSKSNAHERDVATDNNTTNRTVKRVQPADGEIASRRTKLKASQRPAREEIILYKDEQVIRQMCVQLITAVDRNQGLVGKFMDKIQSVLDKVSISADDFDEDDISEFTIKPVLKYTAGMEAGVEFEFKWDLSNEINITKAIWHLFSKLRAEGVSRVIWHIEKQDHNTPLSALVFAGKPVCVCGAIGVEQSANGFLLKDGVHKLCVLLDSNLNKLQPSPRFLDSRPLYVLGMVDCVQPLKIKAGAVLLSTRTVFSISQMA